MYKRERLLKKYLASFLKENGIKIPVYTSYDKPKYGKKIMLASADSANVRINFYLGSLRRMFDERLLRVIEHEKAHLYGGANEKRAKRAEPKEPEYGGIDD